MEIIEINNSYRQYNSPEELSGEDFALVKAAVRALDGAYTPYSHFRVGAAVQLEDGLVVLGSNQENAAFPSGLCAERTAIFSAASQHPGHRISSIAVTASPGSFVLRDPVSPCGACRQVISEYEHKQGSPIRILLHHEDGRTWEFEGIHILLPIGFQEASLKK